MEEQVNHLLNLVWTKFLEKPKDQRLLVAIAGAPGSGKTTLSRLLTSALNTRYASLHHSVPSQKDIASFVPMDGYHYSRAQLDLFPNAEEAHRRRGSDFTFDGEKFVQLVKRVSEGLNEMIYAPSFDHALKDPVEGEIKIEAGVRIVVFEGIVNILLPTLPWTKALPLYTLKVFISAPEPVLRSRLATRHLAAGLVTTLELGQERADFNDIPNGRQIQEGIQAHAPGTIDLIIESKDDEGWAPK